MTNRGPHARLLHPALGLCAFWLFVYGLYLVAPIQQRPEVSLLGLFLVGGLIAVYVLSALLSANSLYLESPQNAVERPGDCVWQSQRLTRAFLVIGIAGTILNIYSKVTAIPDLSFSDAAALRAERAQQLLEAVDPTGGAISAIAFLCYPAGFVGITVAMLRFEQIPPLDRALCVFFALLIFLHGIATGGRSTLLVLIIFVALSSYVRHCRGLPLVPRSWFVLSVMVLMIAGFLAYSTAVWQIRAELSDLEIDDFLDHADEVWGVIPTPRLEALADALNTPSLIVSTMSTLFYFTQSLAVAERIVAAHDLPLMLGSYHIDIVAALMRTLPGSATFLGRGYDTLLHENIYGFFAGAWGALYIDFGLVGSLTATAIWGGLSGLAYRQAKHDIDSDKVISYIYCLYAILISFVSPPFGFSNSAITFFWFFIYLACLHQLARGAPQVKAP